MYKIKRRRVRTQSIKLQQDTHGTPRIQIKYVRFSQQSLEDHRLSMPHPAKESGGLTFTGFAIFIQLQTRRTPAVETSDGVTAESLAASVGLLTFVHV